MNLREWYSNDPDFIPQLDPADQGQVTQTKMLGVRWNNKDDTVSGGGTGKVDQPVTTKRQMLQVIAQIYDPCGWYSPVV